MAQASVFDRTQVRRQRDRAAAAFADHSFLFDEVAERLADRLLDVTRRFPRALDLGCHTGVMRRALSGRGGIEWLVECDLSPAMTRAAGNSAGGRAVADEEVLPFADRSFDLVLSNLSLHWVNDLPGALVQINRALEPDGLFLATMLGGETLRELRRCFIEAEMAEEGGAGPRVSPFADVRDAGALLQRAGFALPVVDIDTITITYGEPLRLLADLRGMGETNATLGRRKTMTRRATIARALDLYRESYADADGRVPATFQILTLTAWRPHDSQQKPLARGSGRASLADVLRPDDKK